MKKLFAFVCASIILLPVQSSAQLEVKPLQPEYSIGEDDSLHDFGISIRNTSQEEYIILHRTPAGMSAFQFAYQSEQYILRNFSYYFEGLKVKPDEMAHRLILQNPEIKPHFEGYILKPGEQMQWHFEHMYFGYTSVKINWSEVDNPKEILELETTYTVPYMTKLGFPESEGMIAETETFVLKVLKRWYLLVLKGDKRC